MIQSQYIILQPVSWCQVILHMWPLSLHWEFIAMIIQLDIWLSWTPQKVKWNSEMKIANFSLFSRSARLLLIFEIVPTIWFMWLQTSHELWGGLCLRYSRWINNIFHQNDEEPWQKHKSRIYTTQSELHAALCSSTWLKITQQGIMSCTENPAAPESATSAGVKPSCLGFKGQGPKFSQHYADQM